MIPSAIQAHRGDLLSVTHGILIHGCNAQGKMGSGVAKAVRDRYPGAYRAYLRVFHERGLRVGQLVPSVVPRTQPALVVVNAITQEHYGREEGRVYLSYPGLRECLQRTRALAYEQGIRVVHFPLIGCGLAGGDWSQVAPILQEELPAFALHLWIPPGQTPPPSVVFA